MARSSRSRPCLHSVRCRRLRKSSKTEVRVGALLSITGAGSSLGNTSRAALEVAVKRLNHQLKNAHVTLDIVDTGQDPDRAKAGFDKLAGEGVKLIIGPQSSSEVAAIMDAANQHGVLDGTVTRLDVTFGNGSPTVRNFLKIGSGY